jgi:hypothetical protein
VRRVTRPSETARGRRVPAYTRLAPRLRASSTSACPIPRLAPVTKTARSAIVIGFGSSRSLGPKIGLWPSDAVVVRAAADGATTTPESGWRGPYGPASGRGVGELPESRPQIWLARRVREVAPHRSTCGCTLG